MYVVRTAVCVLATLLVTGMAVASSGDSGDEESEAECLNFTKDESSETGVAWTHQGAYGVSVSIDEPGRGLTVHLFVAPEKCEVGIAPLTTLVSEEPILEPNGAFPLLP